MSKPKDRATGEKSVRSILMAGVGGQGILRASDILCEVMIRTGLDVKKSEVHGMAQRGGCVTSHVRYGTCVHSPIAKKGDVGILIAFEKMEALRYLDYLRAEGIAIVNDTEIYPPAVNLGEARYPDDILTLLPLPPASVKMVRAQEMGVRAGNPRTENIVLLGVLSRYLTLEPSVWDEVLKVSFPAKLVDANLTAFHLGRVA
ncbi:MAG: indolepyruvate oxidoreductase subunit beta [Syntrophales bacterium]|nr:indolepyruvate oxidoreductase subunit beta [Syntrophales bacterium]HOG07037.1 indolepyruvate oxidoreductase subunit beta [Syntrophales bacterium]HOS78282.1 indolepyruvate oxidoreductase subunit beta [Syntrophales bacterium]HPB70039.1 indolepyruvate oxidoreductase subunit beta [Syntrophales bacterium]HQN25291.1 indolepyruvate oxidoreductase subunit beta [Syntrophales bacterium]